MWAGGKLEECWWSSEASQERGGTNRRSFGVLQLPPRPCRWRHPSPLVLLYFLPPVTSLELYSGRPETPAEVLLSGQQNSCVHPFIQDHSWFPLPYSLGREQGSVSFASTQNTSGHIGAL